MVRDQSVENLLALLIFTVVWNIASFAAVLPLLKQAIHGPGKWPLLTLILPLIGVGLLLHFLRRIHRIIKFGESVLHLQTLPAVPGGQLAGTIHVARAVQPRSPMELRLMCVNRISRSGGKRARVIEHIVWSQAQSLDDLPQSTPGSDIPVQFSIPPDAKPTSDADVRDQILWRLVVRCKTPGPEYLSRFEVPVFIANATEAPTAPAPKIPPQSSSWHSGFHEPGIVYQPIGAGGGRIHFAAARNKSSARATTIIGLILIAIAIGVALMPVDALTRTITLALASLLLFIGVVFGYIAFFLWFVSCDITVRHGSLIRESGTPLYRRRQTFNAADISEILVKQDSNSSSSDGVSKSTFGIVLKTRSGQSIWIGTNVRQGNYAAWLSDQINNTLRA